MGAHDKTKSLVRISECPLELLVKNENNPNKMKPREFDLLCDNMNQTGWTDPALVRPFDLTLMKQAVAIAKGNEALLTQTMLDLNIQMRIVGGHHRFDAATYLGLASGPVTVIMDPSFDEEAEKFQIVRMNVIHGKMDPAAFGKLVLEMQEKYSDELLQDMFGFADEAEFNRLKAQMVKSLPNKELQDKFKEAAKEIKTIDGLASLLNHMFTMYGNTLPHGYMVFDYGGQRSVWLHVSAKTMKAMDVIGVICAEKQRTVDDIIGKVLQLIAQEGQMEFIDSLVAETPPVKIPKTFPVSPTMDNLANALASD